mmetsp:Transcript_16878/g.41845  ORF Transcript_16878/g.41845 Transcript_16878/m.41845 type:complete len:294 (-) Transcript_16878:1275-2156(-)
MNIVIFIFPFPPPPPSLRLPLLTLHTTTSSTSTRSSQFVYVFVDFLQPPQRALVLQSRLRGVRLHVGHFLVQSGQALLVVHHLPEQRTDLLHHPAPQLPPPLLQPVARGHELPERRGVHLLAAVPVLLRGHDEQCLSRHRLLLLDLQPHLVCAPASKRFLQPPQVLLRRFVYLLRVGEALQRVVHLEFAPLLPLLLLEKGPGKVDLAAADAAHLPVRHLPLVQQAGVPFSGVRGPPLVLIRPLRSSVHAFEEIRNAGTQRVLSRMVRAMLMFPHVQWRRGGPRPDVHVPTQGR